MTEKKELASESKIVTSTAGQTLLFNNMPEVMRGAELMAQAKGMVPNHLLNNPGGCMGIIMQAQRWGMDAFAVAQKTHIVSGTIGYEAQLVNAVVTSMAPTTGRIHYDWFGPWEKIIGKFKTVQSQKEGGGTYQKPDWNYADEEGLGVNVWATFKGETEPRTLTLLLRQATVRNSTLWASDPRQQLAYLAVKRWARLYCPDVLLGVYTPDELEQAPATERDITPRASAEQEKPPSRAASLAERLVDEDVEDVVAPEEPEHSDQEKVPTLTYASVAEAINKAESQAALSELANGMIPDFLHEGENSQFREELMAIYKLRQAELAA